MKLMNCQRNAIDLLPFHTHAQVYTQIHSWVGVGCQTICPATSCALPLPLFGSLCVRACMGARDRPGYQALTSQLSKSQQNNECHIERERKRERWWESGRVAEWESAAILRIMLYKRFALCLLPQAESVASRCARGECMYIGHWTHQWSLDTEHWLPGKS